MPNVSVAIRARPRWERSLSVHSQAKVAPPLESERDLNAIELLWGHVVICCLLMWLHSSYNMVIERSQVGPTIRNYLWHFSILYLVFYNKLIFFKEEQNLTFSGRTDWPILHLCPVCENNPKAFACIMQNALFWILDKMWCKALKSNTFKYSAVKVVLNMKRTNEHL